MLNAFEKRVRSLMIKDNSLDSWICETEAGLRRDLTIEEEESYIKETAQECIFRSMDLKCSLEEAYKDIMY